MAKAKWKIVDCDSQDSVEGDARRAIDDDPTTFWHSRYRDQVDPMPHHITVDLGEPVTIRGFIYTPRQDQWDGGIVMRARFEVSQDGKKWTAAADDVDFDNIVNSRQQQLVKLRDPMDARLFPFHSIENGERQQSFVGGRRLGACEIDGRLWLHLFYICRCSW